ncbi:tRNA guanosine(34) transglycosylase Tgt [Patescibacteria group bacterium]
MKKFKFKIKYQDKITKARLGEITTPHGKIQTPAFVPVGTQATVKSLTPEDLYTIDTHLFFVNTYHAYLRPGVDIIKKAGGLHKFMNWERPLITDSGGFQVFSLGTKKFVNIAISESAVLDREKFTQKKSRKANVKDNVFPDDYRPIGELVKIDEDGVTFTSHWDGTKHRFTPEVSMQLQWDLGSDIHIAFDECAPYPSTHEYTAKAMDRTHRWAARSLEEHRRLCHCEESVVQQATKQSRTGSPRPAKAGLAMTANYQALYGVIQGGIYEDLRVESAKFISNMDIDGIAIGGVSVGETKSEMKDVLKWVSPYLPDEKPRHLLGVGEIDDIFALVEYGMDTFDCVQPTRLARMGHLFTKNSKFETLNPKQIQNSKKTNSKLKYQIDITKKIFAGDVNPVEASCKCYTCQNYSKAYIHHLFRVRELLGYRLATIHNIYFMNTLVTHIRKSIKEGSYLELKKKWV